MNILKYSEGGMRAPICVKERQYNEIGTHKWKFQD